MQIPNLGAITKHEKHGWLFSSPMTVRALGAEPRRIVLEGYDEEDGCMDFQPEADRPQLDHRRWTEGFVTIPHGSDGSDL